MATIQQYVPSTDSDAVVRDIQKLVAVSPSNRTPKVWEDSQVTGFIVYKPKVVNEAKHAQIFWSLLLGTLPSENASFDIVNLIINCIMMGTNPSTDNPLPWTKEATDDYPASATPKVGDTLGEEGASSTDWLNSPNLSQAELVAMNSYKHWFGELDPKYQTRVTSYTAMILFRLVVKSVTNVHAYLVTRSMDAYVSLLKMPSAPGGSGFIPVSLTALSAIKRSMDASNPKIKSCLAHMMQLRKHLIVANDDACIGYLDGGCMLHLASNGLALLNMLQSAAAAIGCTPADLAKYMITTANLHSLGLLVWYQENYQSPRSENKLASWARILNPDYFFNLRVSQHMDIAKKLAGVLDQYGSATNIWDIAALSQLSEGVKATQRQWAVCAYQYHQKTLTQSGLTTESTAIMTAVSTIEDRPPKTHDTRFDLP